jgi:hypothetical protein
LKLDYPGNGLKMGLQVISFLYLDQFFREHQLIIADSVKILDTRRQLVTILLAKMNGGTI